MKRCWMEFCRRNFNRALSVIYFFFFKFLFLKFIMFSRFFILYIISLYISSMIFFSFFKSPTNFSPKLFRIVLNRFDLFPSFNFVLSMIISTRYFTEIYFYRFTRSITYTHAIKFFTFLQR